MVQIVGYASNGPNTTLEEKVNDQIELFQEQPADVKDMALKMLRHALHGIESFFELQSVMPHWVSCYSRANNRITPNPGGRGGL